MVHDLINSRTRAIVIVDNCTPELHRRLSELFTRLFHQRQAHDDSLLKAAQACALLYSFQGEALTGDKAELPVIASLNLV
jgi:hypothetical protein